ncbi:MAG TPA: endospore germination permease [Symbiobacteriaceae bacterium]|nr:endospore germination permease [Symbiobacteriaceae bacterium]
MSQVRISARQAAMLLITPITAIGHLLFVRIVFRYAGRDGWISLLIALSLGAVGLAILIRLLLRHEGMSLLQICQTLFGPVLGRCVGLIFIGYIILINAIVLRSFGDFMRVVMPQTPIIALIGVMAFLGARTARMGLEVVARANDVLLPLLMLTGALVSLMVSKDKQPRHLLPIMEHGWQPVLTGAVALQGLFAEMVLLGLFGGAVAGGRRALPKLLWVMAILGVMFIGPVTGPTTLFGPASVRAMTYPTWEEVKHIQIADMVGNLDVMGVLLWTLGTSVQTSLLLWASSTGVSWFAGLSEHRAVVAPVTVLTVVLAVLSGSSALNLKEFLARSYPVLSITVGVLLPLLLLLWTEVRLRLRR